MSTCPTQIFSNISREKWGRVQSKASQNNIILSGDAGEVSEQGFTFSWRYESGSESLTIQCLKHPFWATCDAVNGKVNELIKES